MEQEKKQAKSTSQHFPPPGESKTQNTNPHQHWKDILNPGVVIHCGLGEKNVTEEYKECEHNDPPAQNPGKYAKTP
jgi:hypothetical protein